MDLMPARQWRTVRDANEFPLCLPLMTLNENLINPHKYQSGMHRSNALDFTIEQLVLYFFVFFFG